MWEKKSPGTYVKTTEKAVRKIADKKIEMINQTAEWMKKYLYAEWPENPDKAEQMIKEKILSAIADDIQKEPMFTAWVLYQVSGELAQKHDVKAIWE